MNVEARLLMDDRVPLCNLRLLSSLLFVVSALSAIAAPGRAWSQAFGAEPRLTYAQKKIVRKIESQLRTRFNSQDNPGDRDTWYVIVFTDVAAGARQSRSVSGDMLTITRELQAASNSAAKIIQGREQAALLLLQYYYAGNSAASRLRPTVGGTTDRASADGAKVWRYLAFEKEEEAAAFFERINPEKRDK